MEEVVDQLEVDDQLQLKNVVHQLQAAMEEVVTSHQLQ